MSEALGHAIARDGSPNASKTIVQRVRLARCDDGRLHKAIRETPENRYNSRLAEGETFVAVRPELVTKGAERLS